MSKKVIVIGGVAAGASTVARLRRLEEDAEIVMIERGEDISFANCGLPYYINGTIPNRKSLLVQTPRTMFKRFNIDIRTMSLAQKILRQEKKIEIKNLVTGDIYQESYDYLVLCTGATPVIPNIHGFDKENVFTIRNIPDSDIIKQYIENQSVVSALVVGGGFIGLEMTEILHQKGIKVNLVESGTQVMNVLDAEMAAIVHKYLKKQGVNLILRDKLVSLDGGQKAKTAVLASGNQIPIDMAILSIGIKPEVWLAKEAGLRLGSTGGILVDEKLRTSDPNIFAAGDAIQVKDMITNEDTLVPLAGPSNRQGWVVANNIADRNIEYTGTQATGIVKLMEMTIAYTGKNEKQLQETNIEYLSCHVHPFSHATYYPGANQMCIKILFTPKKGKILGAQIVGYDGVDKRIDVLATAIYSGLTVFDLQKLQLAYAPPFSSAKDPINIVGYAAANIINKDIEVIHWPEVNKKVIEGALLIDVRTPKEIEKGMVNGARNIPLDEIRAYLDDIPKDKEVLLYCQVGLRSYIAARILSQRGFKVKNISGGYRLYNATNNQ